MSIKLGAEIRSSFLKYFERQGHKVITSSSLVPNNDPTLLFTNAGMVQFKDVFTGREKRPYTRATTSQKCVRAGGKHNDLENVGFTARHHTFFEMLGNFSFGDYFKKDAIHFAWEFVTQELALPREQLYVSVYKDDDEAADIWHRQEGIASDRIFRFGEKDNYWSMGDVGPCGPCTEIFIDRGEKCGCCKPSCAVGCDCDRFTEFWNLVFMQFERDASGKMTKLPKPSVDTGAGLERLAMILQGTDTNYDTDLFLSIIDKTASLTSNGYKKNDSLDVSFRVIADHSRATAFLIGDGVMPSNEGRGYVLRRIMRRAIRHGKKLGFQKPFLTDTASFVIDQMKGQYPELIEKRAFIERVVQAEEEQFLRTLERGLALLDDERVKLGAKKMLPGDVVFKLYDTYGFPADLTRVICSEQGISIDEPGFNIAMDQQRAESRKHWKGSGDKAVDTAYHSLAEDLKAHKKFPTFTGYEKPSETSECVGLLATSDGILKRINSFTAVDESNEVQAIFLNTPFYGESGGQVGDHGIIRGADGFQARVLDTQKPVSELIVTLLSVERGSITVGKTYLLEIECLRRELTARNHTATHLLHWALREVLGPHIKQAGSLVEPSFLRFDFTHFSALTSDEIRRVEDLINEKIWAAATVKKRVMHKDAAVAAGAVAFFGEKYGDEVRVVSVGDFSTELCGGTHVDNASEINFIKIASESGIAAGVRRIVGYTSRGAFEYLRARDEEMKTIRERVRASSNEEVFIKLDKLQATEKELRKTLEKLQAQSAGSQVDRLLQGASSAGNIRIVVEVCEPDPQGVKRLREIADQVRSREPAAVVLLGMKDPENNKAYLLIAKGTKTPAAIHSGELLQKIAPLIDGRGGGKPDLAQAGGSKPDGITAALKLGVEMVTQIVGG